ncbi:MAG: DNA polymerase I [Thermoleophilia bacterium]
MSVPAKPAAAPPPDVTGAVFLIDGNSLAYRAFYALPETIVTSEGLPTNALYGFSTMLMKILADYRPAAVVVAWDAGKRVFRHEAFEEYKAHRKPTPDNLRLQFDHFAELVEAFGCESFKKEGYEADDILATLAREARQGGHKAVVVTADRDALQLVGDDIFVMTNTKGISEVKIYDRDAVIARYGIPPEQVPDFIGLKGDTSDNIPGVPGIGDKTAALLLNEYDSLEEILAHTADLKGKRRELLEEYADQARLSRDLATMNDEVPVGITGAMSATGIFSVTDPERLRQTLARFEFNSLLKRLEEMGLMQPPRGAVAPVRLKLRQVEPGQLTAALDSVAELALAWEEQDGQLRLAFCDKDGDTVFLAVIASDALATVLDSLTGGKQPPAQIFCHDYKSLLRLAPDVPVVVHDTLVAAYLLNSTARTYTPDQLAEAAGVHVEVDSPQSRDRELAVRAAQVLRLAESQRRQLEDQGQTELFAAVEMPLVRILSGMERAGIRVDLARLGELAAKVSDQIDELADEIRQLAGGEEFNLDSPQQLSVVLFERLKLPTGKKTKSGFSTDASVLKGLKDAHPIIPKIEIYRELTKLSGTYLQTLPQLADPDTWRIHTTFNQTVTATGRISSSNPNLQNIPVRTPLGEKIRDCFVPAPGLVLIAADYSQVELRILAHLSGEPKLRQAFAAGDDVHRDTAAEVFDVPLEQVTGQQRSRAKTVNFGIMYGISAFGLAEQLDISREEAAGYIEAYLARYAQVAAWRERVIAQALQDGFVATVMGRRRPIQELRSSNPNDRRLGERLAVNTVIQGSAADIMKVAMVGVSGALGAASLQTRMVLQVHDELVFEAPPAEVDQVSDLVKKEMADAWALNPPLEVDLGVGDTWVQAK